MSLQAPVNRVAEQELLGACLKHEGVLDEIVDVVEPATFYTPAHAIVFSAACRVALDGPITPAAVIESLRESGELKEIGGDGIINQLVEAACDTASVNRTATIMLDLARRRDMVAAARRVAVSATNGEDDGAALEELLQLRDSAKGKDDGWTPLDSIVMGVLSGTHRRTEPTILTREDGSFLLYESKLNWLAGPPESQKSYLALLAVIQEMEHGRAAVYIDFEESDGITIAERAVAIGLGNGHTAETILTWLCGPLKADGTRDANKRLFFYTNARTLTSKLRTKTVRAIKKGVKFVVLDGCAAAMGAAELEEDKARDVNLWLAGSVWPFVRAGAGVVVIDHVVKNSSPQGQGGFAARGPRGSGAKLAAVSGVTIIADPKEPGSAFTEGRVELWVSKDRPGRIKTVRRGAKRLAGVLVSTPTQVENVDATRLRVVNPDTDETESLSREERDAKWRRIAAERVCDVLDAADAPMSKTEVKDALRERAEAKGAKGLRSETVVGGVELLVSGGWVTITREGKAEKLNLVRMYREEFADLPSAEVPEDPF